VRRRSEKYVVEGSKYAHWIRLYLSFHLNWVLGPFVHGRLQNLQTSEVTFAHVETPLMNDGRGKGAGKGTVLQHCHSLYLGVPLDDTTTTTTGFSSFSTRLHTTDWWVYSMVSLIVCVSPMSLHHYSCTPIW